MLGPRPKSVKAAQVAVADKVIAFVGELQKAVEANQNDCEKLAAAIKPVVEKGKPALAEAAKVEKEMAADAKQWMQQYATSKLEGSLLKIATAIDKCKSHAGVQAAVKDLMTVK